MDLFTLLCVFLGFIVMILPVFILFEKNNMNRVRKKISNFGKVFSRRDMRAQKRVSVPADYEIRLKPACDEFKGNRLNVMDISAGGMRVRLKKKIKKFPEDMTLRNTLIKSPGGRILINKMNIVRIESSLESGILAFKIKDISPEQSELLTGLVESLKSMPDHGTS